MSTILKRSTQSIRFLLCKEAQSDLPNSRRPRIHPLISQLQLNPAYSPETNCGKQRLFHPLRERYTDRARWIAPNNRSHFPGQDVGPTSKNRVPPRTSRFERHIFSVVRV